MMLMLAQSNPQLLALIGTQANITKELERVEHQSRLEQLSPAELQRKNTDLWKAWLQEYRWAASRTVCTASSTQGPQ